MTFTKEMGQSVPKRESKCNEITGQKVSGKNIFLTKWGLMLSAPKKEIL
jgi:hypothetical protein|tara:strand:- start:112 stop:258 length:147 start_codon:yes stop_codon:yes gene_type:complete